MAASDGLVLFLNVIFLFVKFNKFKVILWLETYINIYEH